MKSPIAVVAGAGLNGLGVVRSLAEASIPIILLVDEAGDPAAKTRYAIKRRVKALGGELFVEDLLALRAELDHDPVLFLTQDKTVETVDAYRDRILPHVKLAMPNPQSVNKLMDKQAFNDFAISVGVPLPQTLPLQGDEVPSALSALMFPCIVKPSEKNAAYMQRFKKAYIVDSAEEALDVARQFRTIGLGAVIQEWIPGDEEDIYFYLGYFDRNSDPVIGFSGRKILSWPPQFGGTVSCIPAPEAKTDIEKLSCELLKGAEFSGMAGVEFKMDRRTGIYYVIEPTICRTDFQSEIATLNGVNLPLAQYRVELGLTAPAAQRIDRPVGWTDPTGVDTLRARGEDLSALERFPITFRDAYFRPSDPFPWIDLKLDFARRLKRAVVKRIPIPQKNDEQVS